MSAYIKNGLQMNIKDAINLMWVLSSSSLFFNCNKPESEDYLIPYGYKGRVDVVFNQKGGVPLKYENGRRAYMIPRGGILLTQFKDEYGLMDHHYFYLDSAGKRIALKVYQSQHNNDGSTKWDIKDIREVGIFLDGTTGNFGANGENKFQEFLVSDREGLDSFYTTKYKQHFEARLNNFLNGMNDVDSLNAKEMDSVENQLRQKKTSKQ
jgi:hypothetical protein